MQQSKSQAKYLNAILTVNAVLLSGLIWTQVAGQPLLATQAVAQSRTRTKPPKGLPNSSAQRAEMVKALRDVKASVDATTLLLKSGNLKVQVANIGELNN